MVKSFYHKLRSEPEIVIEVVMAVTAAVLVLLASGCNTIQGGQAQKHDDSLRVEIKADRSVVVEDNRAGSATTQPSANGWGNPSLTRGKHGDSLKFEDAKETFQNVWPLVLLFLGGAVVCWLIKERLAALMFTALAALTMLYPLATVLLAIGVIAFTGWSVWRKHKQIILGNEAGLAVLPPEQREKAVIQMERLQDDSTKRVVNAVTSTPEAKAAAADAKNGKDHK